MEDVSGGWEAGIEGRLVDGTLDELPGHCYCFLGLVYFSVLNIVFTHRGKGGRASVCGKRGGGILKDQVFLFLHVGCSTWKENIVGRPSIRVAHTRADASSTGGFCAR